MEIAGLNIVMDADFDQVYSAFGQANTMLINFANNVKNTFNGIPDFKGKFNFSSNGASQAAQDAREYARAAREQAAADLDVAKASDIAQRAQDRKTKATKAEKDEYGQLVAANQLLVREYYNAAASIIKYGDASGITAAQLENLRKNAKAGQDQLQAIEAGAGRFQRQVGQYAKGFDPLNNSIQQILREMPAAAVSLNTFFLGISNNLPMFFDELKKINAELAALKQAAELSNIELGKQTSIQNAAAQAAQSADDSLSAQIDSIIGTVTASKEQAVALKEQIAGSVQAATATSENAAAIAANTETLVLNAGANTEDAAALRVQIEANIVATRASTEATAALAAQALATAEATAAATAQPSAMARIAKSIFSVNSLLTVGVLALTLYGGELVNMVTGSKDAEEVLKAQKKAQDELNNAEKQASKEAADHIGKLKTLQFTMTNSEASMRQRTLAYKEAIKLYPAYLDGISQEKALNGGLADIINDKLIPALIAAGKARAYQNKINILTAREIELEDQATELIKDRAKAQKNLNSAAKEGADIAKAQTGGPNNYGQGAARVNLQRNINTEGQITNNLNKNAAERLAINEKIDDSIRKMNENTAKAGDLNPYKKDPKTPAEKLVKDTETALDDLVAKNAEVENELANGTLLAADAIEKKIGNYRSYIQEITKTSKFKVALDDSRVVEAQRNIENLSTTLITLKKNNSVDDILQSYNASISSIDDNRLEGLISDVDAINQSMQAANTAKKALLKMDTNGDFSDTIDIFSLRLGKLKDQLSDAELQEDGRKLNETFDNISSQLQYGLITNSEAATQSVSALRRELQHLIEDNKNGSKNEAIDDLLEQLKSAEIEKRVADLTDKLNTTLKESLSQAAEIVGEGIANIISGTGGLGDLFNSVLSLLAEQFVSFGKAIIEAAIKFQVAKGALESLAKNPVLAGIAGGALILFGETLKANLNKKSEKVGKMADGGIAYAPTRALIGEYSGARSNPEVVAPLNKLKDIIGNNKQQKTGYGTVIAETQVDGQTLRILLKRAEESYNR